MRSSRRRRILEPAATASRCDYPVPGDARKCARDQPRRMRYLHPMSHPLAGCTALVTGGGRGLGRAIAIHLARAGASVAVVARTPDQLDDAVRQIESERGRALAVVADVTEREAVEAAVAETERVLGPIAILVNNAGLGRPYGPVGVVDPDDWWRSHAIHVRGT